MALPEAYILAQCRKWRVFGTGTFSGLTTPTDSEQRRLVMAFLYESARVAGVPFGGLLWATRQEFGELGKRVHYHWLLGAEGWTPTLGQCFTLNARWDALPRCGFSRNHIFDTRLDASRIVEYVTKCLSGSQTEGRNLGGDFYESAKFSSSAASVTLSNSLLRLIGGKRINCVRHGERERFSVQRPR